MNYVILNEFYDIDIDRFKEVDINGTERVDIVFGKFTSDILESILENHGGRDSIFREQWLLRDRGVSFMAFEIPQDILYNEHTEIIPEVIELFDAENFYIEVWSYCFENKWKYFILINNKNNGFYFIDKTFVENEQEGINLIYKKIEEIFKI